VVVRVATKAHFHQVLLIQLAQAQAVLELQQDLQLLRELP
jgi:hypothetical protein